MNNLLNYFKNVENISHAFLIGNVVFDEIESDLTKIIQDKILKKEKINLRENPDIYYYNQYESIISKDEIKELINNLSRTSQFNDVKIYIINGSEKLTDTVYNAILKTLEEPEKNIYAFLITKNMELIKDTIKSRCQKIYLNSELNNKNEDNENISIANEFIELLEKENIKTIALNPKIYDSIEDREKFKDILYVMLEKYNNLLKIKLNNLEINEENNKIIQNNDIISLSKKILVIDNFINLLNNYLNKNLTIDRFIIEMWRCNK